MRAADGSSASRLSPTRRTAEQRPAAAPAAPSDRNVPRQFPVPLWLATSNAHKREELARLLTAALGPLADLVDIRDTGSLPGLQPVAETGSDYLENALLKAKAVSAVVPGEIVLADDSGIEVTALDGAPGVLSNRWATAPDGSALDGAGLNAALLRRLEGVEPPQRGARMVSVVVLVLPGGAEVQARGDVRGSIALDARGTGGFGYDAVFLLPDGRRLSESPAEVKDRLGHRGQAVRGVVRHLASHLRESAPMQVPAALPDLRGAVGAGHAAVAQALSAAASLREGAVTIRGPAAADAALPHLLRLLGYDCEPPGPDHGASDAPADLIVRRPPSM